MTSIGCTKFMTANHTALIGELMCRATEQILWQPARQWVQARRPGARIHCRPGRGRATYHRFDPDSGAHLITYGLRMVNAKFDARAASGWLSAREIQKRGYFGGELSPAKLLAHTCCHEFAHLLQHVGGQRSPGSVHNRHFYTILDELHASGAAQGVLDYLTEHSERQGAHLPNTPFAHTPSSLRRDHWQTGMKVAFGEGSQCRQGLVLRVNQKTCTVAGEGPWQRLRYRVPFSLLREVERP